MTISYCVRPHTLIMACFLLLGVNFLPAQNQVQANIAHYSSVWDKVLNEGHIDEINSDNFQTDITMVNEPEDIVGIAPFKAYYNAYLIGFSEIEFTIIDIFGQDDKLVKHWNFKGLHTGEFLGIPATLNRVDLSGVSLVQMEDGKIAFEHNFIDEHELLRQLGLHSDPGNTAVIEDLYALFSKGETPALVDALSPNVIWLAAEGSPLADQNPYVGRQHVLEDYFMRTSPYYDYFNLTDIKLHEMANNQVLATLRYDTKRKDNGATSNVQVAHLWTLSEGKVVGFQEYADTYQLMKDIQP